jgi:hypothetical protein
LYVLAMILNSFASASLPEDCLDIWLGVLEDSSSLHPCLIQRFSDWYSVLFSGTEHLTKCLEILLAYSRCQDNQALFPGEIPRIFNALFTRASKSRRLVTS